LAEAAAPSDSLVYGRRVQIYLFTYFYFLWTGDEKTFYTPDDFSCHPAFSVRALKGE